MTMVRRVSRKEEKGASALAMSSRQLLILMAVKKLSAASGEAVVTSNLWEALVATTGRMIDRSNITSSAKAMSENGWLEASAAIGEGFRPVLRLMLTAEGENVLEEMLAAIRALDVP